MAHRTELEILQLAKEHSGDWSPLNEDSNIRYTLYKENILSFAKALSQPNELSIVNEESSKIQARLPNGVCVSNVYEAYEAGLKEALSQPNEPVSYMCRKKMTDYAINLLQTEMGRKHQKEKGWSVWFPVDVGYYKHYLDSKGKTDWLDDYEFKPTYLAPPTAQPNAPVAWTITARDGITVGEVPDYAFYSENDAIFHRDNHCFKECNVVPLFTYPPDQTAKIAELTAKCEKMQKLLNDAPIFFSPLHDFEGDKLKWLESADGCK